MTKQKPLNELLDELETLLEKVELPSGIPGRLVADIKDPIVTALLANTLNNLPRLIAIARAAQEAKSLVDRQAEDEGLWFAGQTAPEAHLQQALRELHDAVERVLSDGGDE